MEVLKSYACNWFLLCKPAAWMEFGVRQSRWSRVGSGNEEGKWRGKDGWTNDVGIKPYLRSGKRAAFYRSSNHNTCPPGVLNTILNMVIVLTLAIKRSRAYQWVRCTCIHWRRPIECLRKMAAPGGIQEKFGVGRGVVRGAVNQCRTKGSGRTWRNGHLATTHGFVNGVRRYV